jgi:hypothetical protein
MGANPDELEEAESAPPPPGTNKVEITVGGHTIVVESAEPLAEVAGYAIGLFGQTSEPAKQIPFGFDVTGGQFERAEPYVEPGKERWGDEDARGLGRHQRNYAQDGTTRRLAIPNPPGHHRARLRPMPVDREQRPLP